MAAGSKGPIIVGRYALFDAIASGGMATVHLARLMGEVGFSRTVAIKRLHSQHAMDPEFVSMFIDEARLAARVRHPNVVQTLDVGATDGELFVVMDYIEGESLSRMFRLSMETGVPIDPRIVSRIMTDTLQGLHAAHDAKSEDGSPLEIVHRDVSPQNVLVGVDGISRVLDFGIAKAAGRGQTTRDGQIKGKLAYMAPEQLMGTAVTRRTDVFAAGIVLWELLCGRRLFSGGSEGEIVRRVLDLQIPVVTQVVPQLPRQLEAVVAKALARNPADRFASAAEFADALDAAIPPATARTVGEWIRSRADETLTRRAELVAHIERTPAGGQPMPPPSWRNSDPTLEAPMDIPVDLATAHATSRSVTVASGPSRGKWIVGVLALLIVLGGVGAVAVTRRRPAPEVTAAPLAPPPQASGGATSTATASVTAPSPVASEVEAPKPAVSSVGTASTAPAKLVTAPAPKPPTRPATDTRPPPTASSAVQPKPGGLYTRD
jgi:eukaryotic-like serine/threonine-protein kinase